LLALADKGALEVINVTHTRQDSSTPFWNNPLKQIFRKIEFQNGFGV